MLRTACTLLIALLAAAGCRESPPDLPGGDAPEGFERRRHSARMVGTGEQAGLKVDGIGDLSRTGPAAGGTLRERLIGTWGSGYATEDYPSSFIQSRTLELRADGTATYREEEGSESLGPDDRIETSMHVTKGPWVGMWTVSEGRKIVIEFLVRADPGRD